MQTLIREKRYKARDPMDYLPLWCERGDLKPPILGIMEKRWKPHGDCG